GLLLPQSGGNSLRQLLDEVVQLTVQSCVQLGDHASLPSPRGSWRATEPLLVAVAPLPGRSPDSRPRSATPRSRGGMTRGPRRRGISPRSRGPPIRAF